MKTAITDTLLTAAGFTQFPYPTITNAWILNLDRRRYLSLGNINTPNETVFIYELDLTEPKKVVDTICLRNYDYDGPTYWEDIQLLIKAITKKNI